MRALALAAGLAAWQAGAGLAQQPVATAGGRGIVEAYFAEDADVYPHRVLGGIREKLALSARDHEGRFHSVRLYTSANRNNVFEDIAPRLADVTGDGRNEIVVVETDPQSGASLAVYGLRHGRLVKIAATPHIGTPFRWLAPAAIADLNGDGATDIAYVETPHLGKMLRVWSWSPAGLRQIASLGGVTNHRIGDEAIWGGLRDCGQGSEIVLADSDFHRLVTVSFDGPGLVARDLAHTADPHGFARALACF